ncbi:MAG TPA: nicotinate phosphoribosyltransferase [Chthonomonas sp.]|jgi:nicotinate phosphoribosyltransferase|uniref:nicotinate phosphoribosyltransferase n=1 Tax=Chthonomonas sp. TaxID=2282153 RepID=UPI002B4AD0FB|nr:nicotinate phosphoribosyltransferase [Chthonomonas sp.]HLH79145.1 nicotinate phosphoribosyltransferase [Chthonomonas sp.]
MSVFDGKRLPVSTFKLDVERMRRGWYSDKYFYNIVALLAELARQGYRFGGSCPDLSDIGVDISNVDIGNIEVEMQWFPRRQPMCIVVGVDKALAMLQTCTGYFNERGEWIDTFENLEVLAVHDGNIATYSGDPMEVQPVLKVRGRYRDFAILETPTLGALTRGSRIATNVYQVLEAAKGKDVLFFPARFDAHEVQAGDGYAYHIAVQVYNAQHGRTNPSLVSTDEQGDWWGGAGGGTVAHAAIACFLGDTAETMLAFAAVLPPSIPRIALVDFHNNCLGDTLAVMERMFSRYMQLIEAGKIEEAQRYVLYGVRPDTSGNMRDVSVAPLGDPRLDNGVNPRLCFALRAAIDTAFEAWDLPARWVDRAREWCHRVKIIVSGGFNPQRIRAFEEMHVPVDAYGVGSALFSNCAECGTTNDYTADVVRVRIHGKWYPMAKKGRQACDNPDLKPVDRLPP